MVLRKHLTSQKGWTLIELLVVVGILGILAGVAVPRVMDAIDNARARRADADLSVLRDALARFYLDYGKFPPSLNVLRTEDYVDPNFTFQNAYGHRYFYAVLWTDQGGADAARALTDYVMGDPGVTPGTAYDDASGALPEALATPVGNDEQVYYWGYDGGDLVDVSITLIKLDNTTLNLTVDFTELQAANIVYPVTPQNPNIKYRGQ